MAATIATKPALESDLTIKVVSAACHVEFVSRVYVVSDRRYMLFTFCVMSLGAVPN